MGRPTDYSDELAANICNRIADGESLRAICEDDEMPSREGVRGWLVAQPAFAGQYARAREEQGDTMADLMLDVANESPGQTEHGVDAAEVANRRLKIDVLKWRAGKLRPKVYGDKIQQEHSGELTMPTLNVILSPPPMPADGP